MTHVKFEVTPIGVEDNEEILFTTPKGDVYALHPAKGVIRFCGESNAKEIKP